MGTTPYGFQAFHAKVNATSSGNNTVVSAVTGMSIRVVALWFISGDTNTVTFKSGSTEISGNMEFTDQEKIALPMNEYGWMETMDGEALILNLSASQSIAGMLTYFLT